MSVYIEALKQMNLVDFLTEHYGLNFRRSGSGHVTNSPFGADQRPSFFVRQLGGRWLFKDFSSGLGGSIIDLVGHLEHLCGVGDILRRLEQLVGGKSSAVFLASGHTTDETPTDGKRGYDIEQLYHRFRQHDPGVCQRYLVGRGIGEELVEELIAAGEVLHNRHQGKSYCCFAVRDAAGELQCLDNHEIDGNGKFILGSKSVFSRDWVALSSASEAFITEGIIDYLSVKILEGGVPVGIALLGNQLLFDAMLLAGCSRIISAFDSDKGGTTAFVDLMELYPDKELKQYPLKGHKDPNELLQSCGRKKGMRLSAEEKLELYRAFQRSNNKSDLARQWCIDRSYMYEVIRDVEDLVVAGLSSRQPGRRPSGQPETIKESWQQIGQLQEHNRQLSLERDTSICKEEFLRLRLKWAEIEAAELRGEPVDEKTGPVHKAQIKKKRKRRRLR
ncbi:MAG: toprim domain-containing protein [Pseudomonadota bacterium]